PRGGHPPPNHGDFFNKISPKVTLVVSTAFVGFGEKRKFVATAFTIFEFEISDTRTTFLLPLYTIEQSCG
ncbi:hypothetical protein, partial [Sulfitobacter sp. MF3-043]|uniref:hypothetical protein n=1 Tax=Sulfitobacter sediminivivens TaxID=3252902 RepID=UPI003EBB29F7